MNIVIPMAGMGKRMRPHTLATPKPLLPIAGKPIVERLIEELVRMCNKPINEIGFVIGDFGEEVENSLLALAKKYNSKGKIYYQHEALGTAHAIYCGEQSLDGEIIVAFADTIFYADFEIDQSADSVIWVKEVDDPSSFGVVRVDDDNVITDFVEKPKDFVSNKAIIGIYYFKDGALLREEIKHLIDNDIKGNDEFQLTDALENLKNKNYIFKPGIVKEWLDCGNKDATLATNTAVLEMLFSKQALNIGNLTDRNRIIQPCYIGNNVKLENCIIGPNVSIENSCTISNSIISDSIIMDSSVIESACFTNSMIGRCSSINPSMVQYNVGDFTNIE